MPGRRAAAASAARLRALLLAAVLLAPAESAPQPLPAAGRRPDPGDSGPAGSAPAPPGVEFAPGRGADELLAGVPGPASARPPLRADPQPGPVGAADRGTVLLRALIPGRPLSDAELARDAAASLPPSGPEALLRPATTPPLQRPGGAVGPLDVREAVKNSGGMVLQRSTP